MSEVTDEKIGEMEAQVPGDRRVFRLDAMNESELINLRLRSGFLSIVGIFLFIEILLQTIESCSRYGISGILLLAGVAIPYVYKFVRTPGARVYLAIANIITIICSVPLIISGIIGLFEVGWVGGFSILLGAFYLWIGVGVLKSVRTPALWGREHFTHAQIVAAQVKRSKNENFTDEELPKGHRNPVLGIISIVIAYLFVAVRLMTLVRSVLGIIGCTCVS